METYRTGELQVVPVVEKKSRLILFLEEPNLIWMGLFHGGAGGVLLIMAAKCRSRSIHDVVFWSSLSTLFFLVAVFWLYAAWAQSGLKRR